MNNKPIKAIFEKDFIRYLESLNVKQRVIKGKERCAFCNDEINIDNIAVIFPCNKRITFVCSKIKCTSLVAAKVQNEL